MTIRTAFVRGLDKNLSAAVANLAGRAGIKLAKWISAGAVAKGTRPIFRLGNGITPRYLRCHFILQGGSATPEAGVIFREKALLF